MFTKVDSIAQQIKKVQNNGSNYLRGISEKKDKKNVSLPQSISIRAELTKMAGLEKSIEKLLEEETVMLVTAKKWIIFDM